MFYKNALEFLCFLRTDNKQNGMEQTTNEETEVRSQPEYVIQENLKQEENMDDSFSSENSVLETSIEKNSVLSGLSTNWYFDLVPV